MLVVLCCAQVVLCGAEVAHAMRKAAALARALARACTLAHEVPAQLRLEAEGVGVHVFSPDGVHGVHELVRDAVRRRRRRGHHARENEEGNTVTDTRHIIEAQS